MTNAELIATIRNEIERRITDNTFGAKLELIDILAWLDTIESETTYDTQQYTPRPSVSIEDVARVQFASHAKVFDKKRKAVFDWEQFKEVAGIFYGFGKKDHLDTLESGKPINPDDAMKELDEKIALVKQRGTWDVVDVDEYMDEVRGRAPEKPMNLEKEINRYLHEECSDDDEPGIHEIAEHFAEWGYLQAAEKYNEIEYNRQRAEDSVPKDLEEAAWDCVLDSVDVNNPILLPKYKVLLTSLFIAGAKWQERKDEKEQADLFTIVALDAAQRAKEQMLKEAVEGKIIFLLNGDVAVNIGDTDKYNLGQKIRVIVLPKED